MLTPQPVSRTQRLNNYIVGYNEFDFYLTKWSLPEIDVKWDSKTH
jgi:hypothetical protein